MKHFIMFGKSSYMQTSIQIYWWKIKTVWAIRIGIHLQMIIGIDVPMLLLPFTASKSTTMTVITATTVVVLSGCISEPKANTILLLLLAPAVECTYFHSMVIHRWKKQEKISYKIWTYVIAAQCVGNFDFQRHDQFTITAQFAIYVYMYANSCYRALPRILASLCRFFMEPYTRYGLIVIAQSLKCVLHTYIHIRLYLSYVKFKSAMTFFLLVLRALVALPATNFTCLTWVCERGKLLLTQFIFLSFHAIFVFLLLLLVFLLQNSRIGFYSECFIALIVVISCCFC